MMRIPTRRVVSSSVTSTVPSVTSLFLPALWQASTTEVAMADRKMRPTSCTCPTANGRVLLMLKTIWWTPLLRNTSFTICPRTGWKKWSCSKANPDISWLVIRNKVTKCVITAVGRSLVLACAACHLLANVTATA